MEVLGGRSRVTLGWCGAKDRTFEVEGGWDLEWVTPRDFIITRLLGSTITLICTYL